MSMRHIYRKIAREHGVSVAEVKRDMQAAIDYAYYKNDKSDDEKLLQESILRKDKIPTTEDLIRHISHQIKESEV